MSKTIKKVVVWHSVDDKLPDIITSCRMMLVYTNHCGVDVAYWNVRYNKFLDEPMGLEYKHVLFWAEMTKLSPETGALENDKT